MTHIDAFPFQPFAHPRRVLSKQPRMPYIRSGPFQRHRLIRALSARIHLHLTAGQRLARLHDVIQTIHVINIQRTKVDDLHFQYFFIIYVIYALLLSSAGGGSRRTKAGRTAPLPKAQARRTAPLLKAQARRTAPPLKTASTDSDCPSVFSSSATTASACLPHLTRCFPDS